MDEDAAVSPTNLNLDSQTAPGLRRHQVRTADRPAANLFPKKNRTNAKQRELMYDKQSVLRIAPPGEDRR